LIPGSPHPAHITSSLSQPSLRLKRTENMIVSLRIFRILLFEFQSRQYTLPETQQALWTFLQVTKILRERTQVNADLFRIV